MIIKRTLVVIGNLAVWIPREEMVGEFHKIEGAAVLTIIAREMLTLLGWLEEMLLIGKLACYKGMVIDQCPKEKLCRLTTIFCTKYLIVYQFLLLSLHKITTSGCGIRPTTH